MSAEPTDHDADEDPTGGGHGDREKHRGEMGRAVGVGAVAGLVAAIPLGLLLQFGTGIVPVLGGLIGMPSVAGGWAVHLLIGVLHGVVFALVLAWPAVHRLFPVDDFVDHVLVGFVYGTLVATVTIAALPFAMEVLQATGTGGAQGGPSEPGMVGFVSSVVLAVGHLGYGVVLGAVYGALQGADPDG